MIQIESNGSRWLGQEPATIDELVEVLRNHPLDDWFIEHGTATGYSDPVFPPGAVCFFGNFADISHVFRIFTDEPETITKLRAAAQASIDRARSGNPAHDPCTCEGAGPPSMS